MAEPQPPLLRRKATLGGAEETTSGTDVLSSVTAALTATAVYDATIAAERVYDSGMRMPSSKFLGHVKNVDGIKAGRLRFQQQVGPGDRFIAMLTGAGFSGSAPTSNSANRKTWTFKKWHDGALQAICGAAADLNIEIENGKPVLANWDWLGRWITPPNDTAMPSDASFATLPYVATGVTCTINSATPPRWAKISIAMGNEVILLDSPEGAVSGIAHAYIVERSPRLTIDVEARLKAEIDQWALMTTPTEIAINIVLTRGANTLTINAPKAQRIAVEEGERNRVLTQSLTFSLNRSSGDDEITFVEA